MPRGSRPTDDDDRRQYDRANHAKWRLPLQIAATEQKLARLKVRAAEWNVALNEP